MSERLVLQPTVNDIKFGYDFVDLVKERMLKAGKVFSVGEVFEITILGQKIPFKVIECPKDLAGAEWRILNESIRSKRERTGSPSGLVDRAIEFARKAHGGELDDEGKDYVDAHLIQTLRILRQVTDDEEILAAGVLHDTREDTEVAHEELVKEFGERVAFLVWQVTHKGSKEKGYYFPNLRDRDAVLIKFADRLSNLSRMSAWSQSRQEHYLKKSKFWRSEPVSEASTLPSFIKNGRCHNKGESICNIGYACDGCPYNPDPPRPCEGGGGVCEFPQGREQCAKCPDKSEDVREKRLGGRPVVNFGGGRVLLQRVGFREEKTKK
jgi:hypothetical protein